MYTPELDGIFLEDVVNQARMDELTRKLYDNAYEDGYNDGADRFYHTGECLDVSALRRLLGLVNALINSDAISEDMSPIQRIEYNDLCRELDRTEAYYGI